MDAARPSNTVLNNSGDPNPTPTPNPNSEASEPQQGQGETKSSTQTQPIPTPRLVEIATEACDATFDSVTGYEHSQTGGWNAKIINTVLQSLISATTSSSNPSGSGRQQPYKFAITSTIIQHTSSLPSSGDPIPSQNNNNNHTAADFTQPPTIGKRGMHSATGAYWDSSRDGCWSFKYEKPGKGFDVVVSVIWIAAAVGIASAGAGAGDGVGQGVGVGFGQ